MARRPVNNTHIYKYYFHLDIYKYVQVDVCKRMKKDKLKLPRNLVGAETRNPRNPHKYWASVPCSVPVNLRRSDTLGASFLENVT